MAADVEDLLAPVSDGNPVGDDLSYDSERQEIESAFDRSASGEGGAEDVNWRDLIALIEKQSARTKDMWLAGYLMRAGARMGRIDTVARGAQFLAGLLDRYWDKVHPQLDDYGFQGRKAPVESLTRLGDFLNPLKATILVRHPRLGEFTSNDIERFARGGESEDGYGMFRAAMAEMPGEELEAVVAQIDDIKTGVARADAIMTMNAGSDTSVNFAPTYDALASIRKSLIAFLPSAAEEEAPAESAAPGQAMSASSSASPGGGGRGAPGAIESRDDVMRALDAIADYYRRKEPASPVPLALRRAREWVTLDFLQVLEDIAPGSLDEAKRILTSNRSPASSQGGGQGGDGW